LQSKKKSVMRKVLNKANKTKVIFTLLLFLIIAQTGYIARLISQKDHKNYQVNLVKINTQKDSIDYLKMKNDLQQIDLTVRELNSFLQAKNISNDRLISLRQDSLSNTIYLSKVSNRYSEYLIKLQNQLQEVPLGMPTNGSLSSNFGIRKNPIPTRQATLLMASASSKKKETEKSTDSLQGNSKIAEKNNPPAEADQMQFHKGIDIAVAYGTNVVCTATGTVIFAGQKSGYGNCIIISHKNGLATLYAHLSEIGVAANDKVEVGQVIAKSGNSGRSTGPHLHYEVHKNNQPINPKLFINI